ncbi:hypothetical protein LCGC14_2995110, partial [marine sediment metagenome]
MLVRVLEIAPSTGNLHFDGGEPQAFIEVDWFRDEQPMEPDSPGMMETANGRAKIKDFVKGKRYY